MAAVQSGMHVLPRSSDAPAEFAGNSEAVLAHFDGLQLPERTGCVPDVVPAPETAAVMIEGVRLQILDRLIEPVRLVSGKKGGIGDPRST